MNDLFGKVLTAASFIMVLVVLAGCQHREEPKIITQVQVQRIEIPKSLLTCSDEPVYGSVKVTVKELMKFTDQLAKSRADCRAKLDAVKRIVEAQ